MKVHIAILEAPPGLVRPAGPCEVISRDAGGRVLDRRPKSPLERAIEVHHQPQRWVALPASANPPPHLAVRTTRIADGHHRCFECEVAWAR